MQKKKSGSLLKRSPALLMSVSGRTGGVSRCQMSGRLLLSERLTHDLTHTAKGADGISGADRTESMIFPEQNAPVPVIFYSGPVTVTRKVTVSVILRMPFVVNLTSKT